MPRFREVFSSEVDHSLKKWPRVRCRRLVVVARVALDDSTETEVWHPRSRIPKQFRSGALQCQFVLFVEADGFNFDSERVLIQKHRKEDACGQIGSSASRMALVTIIK